MQCKSPLTQFRESHDPPMSRAELAALLGVKWPTIWRWEAGTRKIRDDKLTVVSERTGIPIKSLRPDLADLMREAAE